MKISIHYDLDDLSKKCFYKLENKGRFLGSFEDPEGMTKCQCFIMGLLFAEGVTCTDDFLMSIPLVYEPMESL